VLLQHPVEADALFRLGTKGVRPGKVILLSNLSLDAPGVTFCVHPLKGMLKRHQSILLCSNGSFPSFQLPLPGKELLLQLDGHRTK
jgi:hypothetical protein